MELIIALAIAIPIILFPAAFVWYLNISGIYSVVKELLRKKALVKNNKRVTPTL